MWEGSWDTGGMRRYNAVAKKYGMDPIPVKPGMDERRRAAGGVPNWAPDGQGGLFNPMSGERQMAEGAPAAEWVELKDGRRMDRKTGQIEGAPVPQEPNWVELKDGRMMDSKSGRIQGEATPLRGSDRYVKAGEDRMFDTQQGTWVKPDGSVDERKDANQGPVVKVPTGNGDYMIGVYDKKNQVYTGWKSNKSNAAFTIKGSDGSVTTFGGDGGINIDQVPVYGQPGKEATDGAQGGTAEAKPTSKAEYDALPSGGEYIDPTGAKRRKA
jgi:hypothetical protein